jgi:acetylornithine/succinyldiaminopimelate/putrescine aminotransferase
MEFHLKKCQVTNITSKRNIISHKNNIHGHTLEVVDYTLSLGPCVLVELPIGVDSA